MEADSKRLLQPDARWDLMTSELLSQIFVKVATSAHDIIRTVSLVCKGWLEVVVGPYCWKDIHVEEWCLNTQRKDNIDSVVRKLVRRSKCTFRTLSAYRIGNVAFAYVATCGRFLTVLTIPMSEITDDMVKKHAGSLVNLKELDISYCLRITYKGLSYFGRSCHSLTNLKRNLIPFNITKIDEVDAVPEIDDGEAYAIGNTMQGICHLELAYNCLSDGGLNVILTNCKSLTHLDLEGCDNVSLDGDLKERCEQLVFKSPFVSAAEPTESESSGADDDDDDDDQSSSSAFIYGDSPESSDSF